jgi:hypothetical protein
MTVHSAAQVRLGCRLLNDFEHLDYTVLNGTVHNEMESILQEVARGMLGNSRGSRCPG